MGQTRSLILAAALAMAPVALANAADLGLPPPPPVEPPCVGCTGPIYLKGFLFLLIGLGASAFARVSVASSDEKGETRCEVFIRFNALSIGDRTPKNHGSCPLLRER